MRKRLAALAKLGTVFVQRRRRYASWPRESVKSDAFTRLRETNVDTIDVAASNFSITGRSAIVRFDARCH